MSKSKKRIRKTIKFLVKNIKELENKELENAENANKSVEFTLTEVLYPTLQRLTGCKARKTEENGVSTVVHEPSKKYEKVYKKLCKKPVEQPAG